MFFKVILIYICSGLVGFSLANGETKLEDTNLLSAVKQFCNGKDSRNFCSHEHLKLSYEIIRQHQTTREAQRVHLIKMKQKQEDERLKQFKLNQVLKKVAHNSYLRDFNYGRFFK